MAGPIRVDVFPCSAVSVRELIWGDSNDGPVDGVKLLQPFVKLPFVG